MSFHAQLHGCLGHAIINGLAAGGLGHKAGLLGSMVDGALQGQLVQANVSSQLCLAHRLHQGDGTDSQTQIAFHGTFGVGLWQPAHDHRFPTGVPPGDRVDVRGSSSNIHYDQLSQPRLVINPLRQQFGRPQHCGRCGHGHGTHQGLSFLDPFGLDDLFHEDLADRLPYRLHVELSQVGHDVLGEASLLAFLLQDITGVVGHVPVAGHDDGRVQL